MTKNLNHWFLPQLSNNHKPRALHFSTLIFYIAIFLSVQFSIAVLSKTTPQVLGIASDISVDRLMVLTNQKRGENNLQPLKLDSDLSKAAEAKAQDMFAHSYWSHNSPQGKTPWDFILITNYRYLYAGENLAKDFANSDGVVTAWMKSPTHRENILQDKYEDIGFAVVNGKLNGEETTLVVQMFGKREENPQGKIQQAVTTQGAEEIPPTSTNLLGLQQNQLTNASSFPETENKPLINIFQITKFLSLLLGLFLTGLILLDAMVVFRKGIIRISGHNIAHLCFLLALIITILLTQSGVIV